MKILVHVYTYIVYISLQKNVEFLPERGGKEKCCRKSVSDRSTLSVRNHGSENEVLL